MADVKASFRVNKIRVFQSNIQYAVLFLGDRMLFVKIGGQFADGGLAGAAAGGAIGGALGGLVGTVIEQKMQGSTAKGKEQKIRDLGEMSTDELLRLDKSNFELHYSDVISAEIKKSTLSLNGPRVGVLSFTGKKKETFDIAPNQDFDQCNRTVSTFLSDKLRQG